METKEQRSYSADSEAKSYENTQDQDRLEG